MLILQLTDMQIIAASQRRRPDRLSAIEFEKWDSSRVEQNCYAYIRDLIAQTCPHLMILTGDLVYGEFDDSGRILHDFIRFMDSFGIPWAPTWGNHDLESAIGTEAMCAAYEKAEYCLFGTETTDPTDGTGNYSVKIRQENQLIEMSYLLNSHGCSEAAFEESVRICASITESQCRLIELKAKEAKQEAGHLVPGIAAWHIPTEDFLEAYAALGYPKEIGTHIGVTVPAHRGDFGIILEKSWPANRPMNFSERLKESGINGVFVGHDHKNNTSVLWNGIRWTFGLKCGTYDYHGTLGGTLIEFDDGIPVVHHVPTLFKD